MLCPATGTVLAATISARQDMAYCGNKGSIELPDGSNLRVRLALNNTDKTKGLSGIANNAFADDEAMLMVFFNNGKRSINMGDTYFNIDVFFLDGNLTVVGLQRNLTAHPGKTEPPPVDNSREVKARHILEMRSGTRYAGQIKQGMRLKWTSKPFFREMERCMAAIWYQLKQ